MFSARKRKKREKRKEQLTVVAEAAWPRILFCNHEWVEREEYCHPLVGFRVRTSDFFFLFSVVSSDSWGVLGFFFCVVKLPVRSGKNIMEKRCTM